MPLACCLGQGHPKDLANDEHTINNNQMQTKTVFGEVTRQTLPTTACPGHAVFGRVCTSFFRTTNIHTKTKSQHFYAVGMGTQPAMKFRRVQANKGMQPKRAKGQHWATKPYNTLQFPSFSVLPTAFKKLCSNKRGLLTLTPGIFWTYQVRSHPIFRQESWNRHICPLHARK